MEQFEQLLTCAICLDRYRNPKLLPCQHSFCMEPCMDGLVDYVRRQVKCPECRAEHRIPYQGVQAFPTNVTLQRFLELHIEITGELPDPTSGQTMERCGVCSEKSYCALCVHCEKKCCPECKDAHMDILRREITRINSQVRRGLHRLQDALALVEKNTLGLQTNSASVAEEVDEIYRRLSKALKDRTEQLRNELDRYLGTELRGLIQLKENLELEIANIQSNCDLAEAHINENVPWDDAELLDTKELFLRTVEFIRNFEYEAGDYGRRVRFVMAHDPNQLVLHVAGYGELNIKPETGSSGLLGSSSGTLAPPGGSPGLMRSKSDHRLASQYRQPDDDRLSRNRYVPDYEYDAPEYEAPRNKSRYRSRFMRHRDGEDSDGDTRNTVRFTGAQDTGNARERVLDTEDAARGPLSGIFRLTDSPRVMKKLQEYERAGKRKKEEPVQPPVAPQPKPQVQVRKAPTAVARQVSEDDEISRIKKQNKNVPTPPETVEERPPPTVPVHQSVRDTQEREPEELPRRTPISRRTSADTHAQGTRSASSDSSTGSESSSGSGIRSTGAPFTAEEMKQKYLSRAPPTNTTTTVSSGPGSLSSSSHRDPPTTTTSSTRPFQSRFLGAGNRAAPPPPQVAQTPAREEPKKKEEEEDDEDETSSSSEETETETEEESETETRTTTTAPPSTQERTRSESAMARTDIGPLLARSAEARRGSKEDSPSSRYVSPRGSPAQTTTTPTTTTSMTTPGGYTSSRDAGHDDFIDHGINQSKSSRNVNAMNKDENGQIDNLNGGHSNSNNKQFPQFQEFIPDCNNSQVFAEDFNDQGTKYFEIGNKNGTNSFQREILRPIIESTNEDNAEGAEDVENKNSGLMDDGEVNEAIRNGEIINDIDEGNVNGISGGKENGVEDSDESIQDTEDESEDDEDESADTEDDVDTKNLEDAENVKDTKNAEDAKNVENTKNIEDAKNVENTKNVDDTKNAVNDDKNTEDDVENTEENMNIKHPEENGSLKVNGNEKAKEVKEKAIVNGIPKIVINQYSSEEAKEKEQGTESFDSESESSEIDDSNEKLENNRQSFSENSEILLDDNGWVVDEDNDLSTSISNSLASIPNSSASIPYLSPHIPNSSANIPNLMENYSNSSETIPNLLSESPLNLSAKNRQYLTTDDEIDDRNEENNSNSEISRSRIYRQGSIGKNGWMTSDESESETEAPNSPTLPLDGADDEEMNNNVAERENASSGEWNIEEGRMIHEKKNCDDMVNDDGISNQRSDNEKVDAPQRDVSVPMQMVTTVLCVSVLCCSVLINLFL